MDATRQDFAGQRKIFKAGSKTYFNSSLFFPRSVRADVIVLYAFVRVADDFVDSVPQQGEAFYEFVSGYRESKKGKPTGDPVIDAFVDLERRKQFDPEWTDAFLRSMEKDLTGTRCKSIDDTLEYVYGSAEVIGLYMCRVMEIPKAGESAAIMLGRSMQFINFIRDIAEDHELGRMYLPAGEWPFDDLGEVTARANPNEYVGYLTTQLNRYREYQGVAEQGYHYLPRRYRIPIKTAADMYNWTASVIEKDPFVVFRRKVKPSKARILARIAWNWMVLRD